MKYCLLNRDVILSYLPFTRKFICRYMNEFPWKMYLSEMLFSNVSANDDSYCRIMLLLLICLIEIGVNKQVLRGRGVHPFLCRWWNKRMYHFSKAPCVEITWFYILIGFRLDFKDIVSKLVYVQIVLKWEWIEQWIILATYKNVIIQKNSISM